MCKLESVFEGRAKHLYIKVMVTKFGSDEWHEYQGIVDTGAVRTLISPKVLNDFPEARYVKKVRLNMANKQIVETDSYMMQIRFGGCTFPALPTPVLDMSDNYDVIVGMDLLTRCDTAIICSNRITQLLISQEMFKK